ncbi:MAG: hypothetical protein ACK44A_13805 [Roseateles sp.]
MPATTASLRARRAAARPSFGRVSIGVHGRVMVSRAEGPFDTELMAAVRRAIALAGRRLPADRRFGDLIEIHGSLVMDLDALAQLRRSIEAFTSRGLVALSTVFVVPPGISGIERLPALLDIWRASRPVRRAETFAAGWALVNADLSAAGLPVQPPPHRP